MYTYICEEAFLSYHPGNIAIAPNKLYKKDWMLYQCLKKQPFYV